MFALDSKAIVSELFAGRDPHALFANNRVAYNEFGEPIQIALQVVSLVFAAYKIVREYSEARNKNQASADEIADKWENEMIRLGVPSETAAILNLKLRDDLRALIAK